MNELTFCGGIIDVEDTQMLLSSLSASYDKKTDTITIPFEDETVVISAEKFDNALDSWMQIGTTLSSIIRHLGNIINNTDNEAGDFVQYIKDFLKD